MSFFFKDKEEKANTPSSKSNPQSVSSFGGSNIGVTSEPTEDIDFTNFLKEVIKKANLPGPDYFEFMEAVSGLSGMPLSEVQKMQTAFTILAKQGLTVDILVNSANAYIAKLNEVRENIFEKGVKTAENIITLKEKTVSDLKLENDKLAKQMQDNTVKIADTTNEANSLKNKLVARKSSFQNTFNNTVQGMQNDIINIKTNLHENAIV